MGAIGQLTAAVTAGTSGWLYDGFGAGVLFGGAALGMLIVLGAGVSQGRALLRPA